MPAGTGGVLLGEFGPRLSLADQRAQAGPPLEHLIDLPHERPGSGEVAEREVAADQLDPGLNRGVGQRVCERRPGPLSVDQRLPDRRNAPPVQGYTGLHCRADRNRIFWQPVSGFEPLAFRLQEVRPPAPTVLAATMR